MVSLSFIKKRLEDLGYTVIIYNNYIKIIDKNNLEVIVYFRAQQVLDNNAVYNFLILNMLEYDFTGADDYTSFNLPDWFENYIFDKTLIQIDI